MKAVSILVSIIVGIASIFVFREHLVQTATALFNSDTISSLTSKISGSSSSSSSAVTSEPTTQEHQLQTPPTFEISTPATNMSVPRAIRKVFLAVEQAEGAGARVRRSIGTPQLRNLTPFLMLDHFSIKPGAGFPDHPHRGQETITYMLSGAVDHEDFAGNKGTIETGDLQFMTAGRGIVHSEMPAQNADGSANTGLQLWVNLPKALKSCEPRYRDLRASEIPLATADDGKVVVRVISGRSLGVDSVKDLAYTPVWLLDVSLKKGGRLAQEVPGGFNVFVYTLEGTTKFGKDGKEVGQYHNVVFEEEGDVVVAVNEGEEDARFVLVGGQILDEPVVQYGPFVVTSRDEVMQAMFDYQTHSNGFERAEGWASEIGKTMAH